MSNAKRLDQELADRGLANSRSQAANLIRLKQVTVDGQLAAKPSQPANGNMSIKLTTKAYVSRAAYKLASVSELLKLDFRDKLVLDVGSSTGGFTDYALQHGAKKVVAVDVGTDQLHPNLRTNPRIELYEKTDIRKYKTDHKPDMILIDVSFISLRQILPHLAQEIAGKQTEIVAMLKPQFEGREKQKNRGVIKNSSMRRDIIKQFETWVKNVFTIIMKMDSQVSGAKGNLERFYLLKII